MRRAFPFLAASAALAATGAWGQAANGLALFTDPAKGNCIACHQVPEGAGPAVRANVGPRLDAARLAGWDRARLRDLLDDPDRPTPLGPRPLAADPTGFTPGAVPENEHAFFAPVTPEQLGDDPWPPAPPS